MFGLPSGRKIELHAAPVDGRKSFGLCALVESVFNMQVLDGDMFLFINRRRDRLKALYWDRDGWALWYKKLESDCPHFLLFTEIGGDADNFAGRPAAVVGMDSSSTRFGPRRRPMSPEIAVIAPPRVQFSTSL